MDGYKHFIRIDSNNIVIHGYSDAFEQMQQGDIQLSGDFGRHFTVQLTNEHGQFRYKLVNGSLVERSASEMFDIIANKSAKLSELNDRCNATILAGFTSDALGATNAYDFDYDAQMNLGGMLNAITSGLVAGPIYWKASGIPQSHTVDQFKAVFGAGLAFKNAMIERYWTLKAAVNAATSPEEIEAITWNLAM